MTPIPDPSSLVPGVSRHRRLVRQFWWLVGLVSVADFVFGAVFVFHMRDRGLPAATIGGLLAAAGLAATLVEAPSGAWGDRFGQRQLIVWGLVLWGTGLLVFAFATTQAAFATGLLVWTTGIALHSGAAVSLLVNTLNASGEQQRAESAVRASQVVRWVASAAGAAFVAVSGAWLDPQHLIAAAGVLLLPTALWVRLSWPDARDAGAQPVWRSLRRGVALAVRGESLLVLLLVVLSSASVGIVILTWQPVALGVLHLAPSSLGIALFALTAASALGAFATRWTRHLRPPVLAAGLVVALDGLLLLTTVGPFGAAVGFVGAEVVIGAVLAVIAVWSQQIFPDALRTTMTSVMGTAMGATVAATNAVVGRLWEATGIVTAVAVAAGVVGSLACVLLVVCSVRAVRLRAVVSTVVDPDPDPVAAP
ncbi:MFS transporter [Cellulomonas sp. URHB0016]